MTDPNQTFVIVLRTMTRAEIAADLNNYLHCNSLPADFADDDERLTDAICTKYAADLGSITGEGSDALDDENELQCELLKQLGFDVQ